MALTYITPIGQMHKIFTFDQLNLPHPCVHYKPLQPLDNQSQSVFRPADPYELWYNLCLYAKSTQAHELTQK